jgi:hypothetical protein
MSVEKGRHASELVTSYGSGHEELVAGYDDAHAFRMVDGHRSH